MNDKTNFIGYSQTLGLLSGNSSTTLTTNCNGTVNTYADGNWATPLNGVNIYTSPEVSIYDSSSNHQISTLTINSNNMVKQTKVAVFTVERNEDNKVTSAKLVKELWVEVKNGTSLDLAVAKELDKDFDPSTTVIREIYSVTF
jgi:hypothetical protein